MHATDRPMTTAEVQLCESFRVYQLYISTDMFGLQCSGACSALSWQSVDVVNE